MAKRNLLASLKAQPARFYRLPGDVMRDRRLVDPERLEILLAWAAQGDAGREAQLGAAIAELEGRLSGKKPAAR